MKKLYLITAVFLLVLMLCACNECNHKWLPATCTEPQYCEKCGLSNGVALGHDWLQTDPTMRTCSRCGATESTAPIPENDASSADVPETEAEIALTPEPQPTPEPEPVVTHWYDDHVTKMKAQSSALVVPDDLFFLEEPESKTILGEKGVCIYELFAPDKDAEQIGKIDNGTVVEVLARQNDYALFVTSGGLYAWGRDHLIVDENDTPYLVSGKRGDAVKMTMSHTNKVYVLYEPYGIFPHMATMEPGTVVTAYAKVNGFTYVESGAVKGWVYSGFLT